MITAPDFNKKQIAFVFFNDGEKMAFSNDNLVVRDKEGKIKFQCTCYRLFLVFAVGHCCITSALIQKAKKFGFFIAMYTVGFRPYAVIGAEKDGNTMLKQKQYLYNETDIAKHLIKNKISVQYRALSEIREKNTDLKNNLKKIKEYYSKIDNAPDINSIMAFEGLASKIYFAERFIGTGWHGRQPRVKSDVINSTLDIGYTLLFSFIDALLSAYGFDTFCGVLHRQFYMRKSLVCDIIEPFRPIIDKAIKNAYNLGQIKTDDFLLTNRQYKLKWEKSPEYIGFLMNPIIENKDVIFKYIQTYYRAFMKGLPVKDYPFLKNGEIIKNDTYKL